MQEIYNIEVFTITCSLEIALKSSMAQHMPAICIYFDNLSIAKNAKKILNGFSQAMFIKFYELAKLWLAKEEKTVIVQ